MRTDKTTSGPQGAYPAPPTVPIEACPIATTLGSLGRKWTLPILRDIAFFPRASFGLIRKRNPGLGHRTLSLRLQQLAGEELIRKVIDEDGDRHPYYELTPKGLDVWPVLSSLFQYGIRHHADTVFRDRRPRGLSEMYPADAALMLGPLAEFARTIDRPVAPAGPNKAVALSRSPRS